MNWIALLFFIESGLISGGAAVGSSYYDLPDNATYVTLGVEVQAGPVFVGGSVETQQVWNDNHHWTPSFSPYRAIYDFNAGVRFGPFEIGWLHICDHPVISIIEPSAIRGAVDRFYVRGEFTVR